MKVTAVRTYSKSEWMVAVWVFIIGMLVALWLLSRKPEPENLATLEIDFVDAYGACQFKVQSQLVSPKSVEWSSIADVQRRRVDRLTWTMSGQLDAANAFGALLRKRWQCTAAYVGNEKWIIDASIDA